jgi:hypothetical protein
MAGGLTKGTVHRILLIPEIYGPCIPGKPDVVDDTLAIYIIVHNIIIVY